MTIQFPDVPQTNRKPVTLTPDFEKKLLTRRLAADRTDLFVNDANDNIRTLGRLALRRESPDLNDSFALGDLCARQSLAGERLLIFYVGKTLAGYRRAAQQSVRNLDKNAAQRAVETYLRWVMTVAELMPTARNIAVALWAATDLDASNQSDLFRDSLLHLAEQFPQAADIVSSDTPLMASSRMPFSTAPSNVPEVNVQALPPDPALFTDHILDSATPLNSDLPPVEPPTLQDGPERDLLDTHIDSPDTMTGLESEGTASPPQPSTGSADFTMASLAADERPTAFEALPTQHRDQDKSGDFAPGQFIGPDADPTRYEIHRVLYGGMGVVYLAYDRAEHIPVAIKTIQARYLTDHAQAIRDRFMNEALTWVRLEKHPHIVQALIVQTIGERPHIILEYVSAPEGLGSDLKSWIDHRRLDLPTTLEIGLHVCRAMQYAVTRVPGLVHRDLKPANILVAHDGIAKVTDFGLVYSLAVEEPVGDNVSSDDSRLTRAGTIMGTAPYMSPEQCRAEPVDARADIYAVGAILYEMLTGLPVFAAHDFDEWLQAHLTQIPRFPETAVAAYPEAVRALVLRCLAKPREERPESWEALGAELAALYTETTGQLPSGDADGIALEARELMNTGYSLGEFGHSDEALDAYDRALELDPDSDWIWARKGRTLRILRRYDEALACFDRALQINPHYAWASNQRGIVLERIGDQDQALNAYRTASELHPNDPWSLYNQAEILQSRSQYEAALTLLDRVLAHDPAHYQSDVKRGNILRHMKRYEEALIAYDKAIDHAPTYVWAWNGKGLTLRALKRLDEAASALSQAARVDKSDENEWNWYNLAEVLVDLERYGEALGATQQAVLHHPTHAASWAKQAQVLRYLNRYAEALEAYDRALAIQPDYAWAYNGKGILLERMRRYDEALIAYQRATEIMPDDPWHWFNQGNALIGLGRFDEALIALQRSTELDPNDARHWARLGNVYRQIAQPAQALAHFDKALALDPGYCWAWNEKGIVFESQGRLEEALAAYRQASKGCPDEAQYLYNQADALNASNRFGDALPLLERALALSPNNARAWAKKGQLLRRLKRYPDALTAYDRALSADPHYAWAWNGRGLVLSAIGRHEDAYSAFARAAKESPRDVWFWYNQADELLTLRRYMDALDVLTQALEYDAQHLESWGKRGQALRNLGRYKEAIESYDHALSVNAHYAWAWNGRGLALEQMNKREEALASYERAAREDPAGMWYWINQINPLLSLGRIQDALDVAEKATEVAATNDIAWARLGQVLRRANRHTEALDAYERALTIDPRYAWAWNGKGLAYAALEQWDKALPCYEQATTYDATDVWFWHNRGEALLNLNRYDEAVRMFSKALEINPQHEPSRTRRTEARRRSLTDQE